jgi:DNA-binding MarR family transcriptional regulator
MPRKTFDASVSDFSHAFGMLIRRVRASSASEDLNLTEVAVLARLARDGPATTAALARAECMKPQSMGTTVATLESNGLVRRKPHPSDGRQMIIELTPKGAATREHLRSARIAWLSQAIAKLDKDAQQTLFAAGDIMRQLVEP